MICFWECLTKNGIKNFKVGTKNKVGKVDRGIEYKSGQFIDYKIAICFFCKAYSIYE